MALSLRARRASLIVSILMVVIGVLFMVKAVVIDGKVAFFDPGGADEERVDF